MEQNTNPEQKAKEDSEAPIVADLPKTHKKKLLVIVIATVVALTAVGFIGTKLFRKNSGITSEKSKVTKSSIDYDKTASNNLTRGHCSGSGSVNIGPPMPLEQTSFILPYGLVVGGHVTPIDHQYYNGLDIHAVRDTYDVIAPADGRIVDIGHRGDKTNTPLHSVDIPSSDEYRIVIAHSCSFLTYVDLVTSLDDNIKSKLPADWSPNNSHDIDIPVKKGEVIGHIGGQTLDFAVWDLTKPLAGFVNATAYDNAEPWKRFTASTTSYLDSSIKAQVIAKYVRSATPIDGKIDYDQAGKLIGNWFLKGSNGYLGGPTPGANPGYFKGHLSFAPDAIDPSVFVVSTGSYTGTGGDNDAQQFWVVSNSPDPATVTPSSGLIKYQLTSKGLYNKSDGSSWGNSDFAIGLKANASNNVAGVVLVQMIDDGHIKVQFFPGKTAAQVNGFTDAANLFDRGDGAHLVLSNTAH